jgi:hypothetical protein
MNWKTTIFGALAAIIPYIRGIVPEEFQAIADAAAALALALMGYFAADRKPAA